MSVEPIVSKVYQICNRYESGYGHGLKRDGLDLAKTPHADAEMGEAYQIGYDAGSIEALSQPAPVGNSDWDTAYRAELAKWPKASEQTENTSSSIKSIFWFRAGYESAAKRNESTREAVIEECAKAAKDEALVDCLSNTEDAVYNMAVRHCVDAIRALSTAAMPTGSETE